MADDSLIHSIFIGLIFSFLLAKLISILFSFKRHNLIITRTEDRDVTDDLSAEPSPRESVANIRDHSDSDDWEEDESSELDEEFVAATTFVAAAAADGGSMKKVPNEVQLQLYGFYKIATEGTCISPQPSPLKIIARAKWRAWQKLGAMLPEDAMEKYIELVTKLYPNWASGASSRSRDEDGVKSAESKGPMGPVFSSFMYEEDSGNELKMDAIHNFAREGESEKMLKCLENGVSVNANDSENRTPLHWAVDRGHFVIVELLVRKKANVNAKDNQGQTPLHYAAMCGREAIAEFLVKHNADIELKDNDGDSSYDLCNAKWFWMQKGSVRMAAHSLIDTSCTIIL